MEENQELQTVPFTTEDGTVVELLVMEETTLQGVHYILVTDEADPDREEADVMIMKETQQKETDEIAVYDIVEDEAELQAVAKVFAELMEDVEFKL